MKSDLSKNIIITLLIVIIVILLTFIILIATNKINFNNTNNNILDENESLKNGVLDENNNVTNDSIYSDFLNNKEYLKDFNESDHGEVTETSYVYYDLDSNGIDELIIYLSDGFDFGTNLFYTYDKGNIKFIDKIYHFGSLGYNKEKSAIVYTITRPTMYGYAYGFYQLKNNSFELINTVGATNENDIYKYFISSNSDESKEITEQAYHSYFDNNIVFDESYIKLN